MTTTPQVTNFCPRCEEYARQIDELQQRVEELTAELNAANETAWEIYDGIGLDRLV